MKATDLRIGNFITYNTVLAKVESINKKDEIGLQLFHPHVDPTSENASQYNGGYLRLKTGLEPIVISEEWLIKFGFKGDDFWFSNEKIRMEKYITSPGWAFRKRGSEEYSTSIARVKYIHQLQNLYFAIFGEELKLSYPKPENLEREYTNP
jgi:hypothetical protein